MREGPRDIGERMDTRSYMYTSLTNRKSFDNNSRRARTGITSANLIFLDSLGQSLSVQYPFLIAAVYVAQQQQRELGLQIR